MRQQSDSADFERVKGGKDKKVSVNYTNNSPVNEKINGVYDGEFIDLSPLHTCVLKQIVHEDNTDTATG